MWQIFNVISTGIFNFITMLSNITIWEFDYGQKITLLSISITIFVATCFSTFINKIKGSKSKGD